MQVRRRDKDKKVTEVWGNIFLQKTRIGNWGASDSELDSDQSPDPPYVSW